MKCSHLPGLRSGRRVRNQIAHGCEMAVDQDSDSTRRLACVFAHVAGRTVLCVDKPPQRRVWWRVRGHSPESLIRVSPRVRRVKKRSLQTHTRRAMTIYINSIGNPPGEPQRPRSEHVRHQSTRAEGAFGSMACSPSHRVPSTRWVRTWLLSHPPSPPPSASASTRPPCHP